MAATEAVASATTSGSGRFDIALQRADFRPAPRLWRWHGSKLRRVLVGLSNTSFTQWGRQDVPSLYRQSGEATKTHMNEIALLAALFITISAEYQKSPPELNANSLVVKAGLSEGSSGLAVVYDINQTLWSFCTFALLLCLTTIIFLIITLGLFGDETDAASYFLLRLGAAQKFPLQCFMVAIFFGSAAFVCFTLVELHWTSFLAIGGIYMFAATFGLFFFALPLLGALDDTVEAMRAGRVLTPEGGVPAGEQQYLRAQAAGSAADARKAPTPYAWNQVAPYASSS